MKRRNLIAVAIFTIAATSVLGAGKPQTFTGEVSDSMCGTKHMMASKSTCTRVCVNKGSNYALVVGDNIYTLHTDAKSVLDELDKLAGEKANVTGVADGETIEVSQVAAAKP
jgi:hypothetical protein